MCPKSGWFTELSNRCFVAVILACAHVNCSRHSWDWKHTSTVEFDSRLDSNLLVNVLTLEGRSELLLSSVETVNIG